MSGGIDIPSDAGWYMTALLAIGGGIRWLMGWSARRADSYHAKNVAWAKELKDREETLDAGVKQRIAQLETKCSDLERGSASMALAVERWRLSVILLVSDTINHRPDSPALGQVRAVLAEAFPIHLAMPPEMRALVEHIDERMRVA